MPAAIRKWLAVCSLLWGGWLSMMLVHECGHALAGWLAGGHVVQVVWHPLVLSRTDVDPNPSPRVEIWAGPVVGCLIPLILMFATKIARLHVSYFLEFFSGFSLLINGLYLGVGAIDPVGDALQLTRLGTPPFALALFGVITAGAGFWLLHYSSRRLGFGPEATLPSPTETRCLLAVTLVLTLCGFFAGNAG